jgi:hypothetical protein
MKPNTHTNGKWNFIAVVTLLIVASIAGMFAPERISWLQGSDSLRWAVAILCGIVLGYVLVWLSIAAPESAVADADSNWQETRRDGKGKYIQRVMVVDLKQVLYFQPLVVLISGWIMSWGIQRIILIISFMTFASICASFFKALRQWEINEKSENASSSVTAA